MMPFTYIRADDPVTALRHVKKGFCRVSELKTK